MATLAHESITPWASQTQTFARVNENRWIADCPECNGAEFIVEGQEMTCGACGAISEVVWPVEAGEIEAVLNRRLHPQTRNWYPGETVDMLRAENLEHGVR